MLSTALVFSLSLWERAGVRASMRTFPLPISLFRKKKLDTNQYILIMLLVIDLVIIFITERAWYE
ncbi:hypothetical protein DBY68_007545 [Pseudocitrobacter sp. RIT415]|nr:hypothetical protein DBY68_007545 [Pseudocitrobacter sp. RIT 415]